MMVMFVSPDLTMVATRWRREARGEPLNQILRVIEVKREDEMVVNGPPAEAVCLISLPVHPHLGVVLSLTCVIKTENIN